MIPPLRGQHPKSAAWRPGDDPGPLLFGTAAEALRELRADPKAKDLPIQNVPQRRYDK